MDGRCRCVRGIARIKLDELVGMLMRNLELLPCGVAMRYLC